MGNGLLHGQPLRRRVLAGDDHVDIMPAAQTMIHYRQQAVGVGRQIHAHDFRFLVDHVINKARILM